MIMRVLTDYRKLKWLNKDHNLSFIALFCFESFYSFKDLMKVYSLINGFNSKLLNF